MGIRRRGLDIKVGARRHAADKAARAEAKAVVERWNEQLAASRDMLWSPTIPAALIAGTPWLDVLCPGYGTSRAIDLRKRRRWRARRLAWQIATTAVETKARHFGKFFRQGTSPPPV
jgi:hypothetical protein